jgi:hypothetical protein
MRRQRANPRAWWVFCGVEEECKWKRVNDPGCGMKHSEVDKENFLVAAVRKGAKAAVISAQASCRSWFRRVL